MYSLEANLLKKYYPAGRGPGGPAWVRAVEEVSLAIGPGETLGLVGESGCGKTTISRLLLLLEEPTSGSILFKGRDASQMNKAEQLEFRRSIQPVFQNPYSSLNPRMRIGKLVSEPLRMTGSLTRGETEHRTDRALEAVGLSSGDKGKFAHEFSGGQRQRIAIARALASEPEVIILDEPVSSQDISIQAQILNLLRDLQEANGVGYLFVAHDLATVRYMCHRVCVMYLGRIVESAATEELFRNPKHPYTQALLDACLPADPDRVPDSEKFRGEPPSPVNPPAGCRFHPRCPAAMHECRIESPEMKEVAPGHCVSCFLHQSRDTASAIMPSHNPEDADNKNEERK